MVDVVHRRFIDFVGSLSGELQKDLGFDADKSEACMQHVINRIQDEYSCESPYIHSAKTTEVSARNRQILKLWREAGWDMQKIATEMGISKRQVYNVISA